MKKKINALDYAGTICRALEKGILLTTKDHDYVNTMTIGWGKIGIEWNRPVFIVYVRESRFTKELLDNNGEFTVNIPIGNCDSRILRYCGTKSGRDTNKIKDMALTLEAPSQITVPGIREYPLTLECRVIYRQRQDPALIPPDIIKRFYPVTEAVPDQDIHIAYYGEIVEAYLIEN